MVFLFIILGILLIIILIAFSKIRIQIVNFRFDSNKKEHINNKYKVIVKLYILGFIPIFRTQVTKAKLAKIKLKERLKKFDFEMLENVSIYQQLKAITSGLNILTKQIKLRVNIGTENAALTSIIVPILTTAITVILSKTTKKARKQFFVVKPVYQNQNLVNLTFSGIFEIKMSHIINIIYNLNRKEKEGVKNYERTSDRRTYGYSYE